MKEATPSVPEYVLVRPIGRGGFGQVWLARNAVGTFCAVKVVGGTAIEAGVDFNKEIKGIRRFEPVSRRHDGLVSILHVGHTPVESCLYYVMELGDDLKARQAFSPDEYCPRTLSAECRLRGRIPADEAALIGAQLADALGFLHGEGLIHRDIKPSNVVFVRGQPRIGDPGLVTAIDASQSIGGTFGYMAPEGAGTPRADIFSLGKLLYVISTGKEPGEFPKLPPEMTEFADADDLRRLNHVILRACAHNPAERYESAAALRKDLLDVHAGGSPAETRRRLRVAKRVGMALSALLFVIGLGYWRADREAHAERSRRAKSNIESTNRRQENNDSIASLAYLGDALAIDPEPWLDLAARRIGFVWRYSPRLVAQEWFTNAVNSVSHSPDGTTIAVAVADGSVWTWHWLRESGPRLLGRQAVGAEAEAVAFSPDSRWVASTGGDARLHLWPWPSSEFGSNLAPRTISLAGPGRTLAWHPRSDQIAVGYSRGGCAMVDLSGATVDLLFPTQSSVNGLAFKVDGSNLAAGDDNGGFYDFTFGAAQAVNPLRTGFTWIYGLTFSPDGGMWAIATGNRAILGGNLSALPARLRHRNLVRSVSFDPAQPPGFERILTTSLDNTVRLWSCRDDEEVIAPIHTERPPNGAVFSPDGRTFVVFTVGGLVRVYALPTVTEEVVKSTTTVSPDGLFDVRIEESTNAVVHRATDGRRTRVPSNGLRVELAELSRNAETIILRQSIGSNHVQFEVRNVTSGEVIGRLVQPDHAWAHMSPLGNCVAIRSKAQFSLWHPAQSDIQSWPWQVDKVWNDSDVRFSAHSPRVAASWTNRVTVYSTTNHRVLAEWTVKHPVGALDLSPDGRLVVVAESPSGYAASTSYVWDIDTQKPSSPPLEMEDGTSVARFGNRGNVVFIADQKGTFILYEISTRRITRVWQLMGMVTDASFSADDRYLVTTTENRGDRKPSVQVWDVTTGTPSTPILRAFTARFGRVRFVGNDRQIYWMCHGEGFQRWHLGGIEASREDLIDLTRLLSCQALDTIGRSIPNSPAELQRLWNSLRTTHRDWFLPPD